MISLIVNLWYHFAVLFGGETTEEGILARPFCSTHNVSSPRSVRHYLYWATSCLDSSDSSIYRYNVDIRYHCVNEGFSTPEEELSFEHACSKLIPKGLSKHFERDDVEINGKTFSLRVLARRTDGDGTKVHISKGCDMRASYRPRNRSISIQYCSKKEHLFPEYYDLSFMLIIGHELGHDILFIGEGIMWSVTHKGSSTVDQKNLPTGPVFDCSKPDLDIMQYARVPCLEDNCHGGYLMNCYSHIGERWFRSRAYFSNRKLSREDAAHLIRFAKQGNSVPGQR